MKKPNFARASTDAPVDPKAIQATMAHFRARVERNKTRRRKDGDPPAALPVPTDRPKGGGLSGGAAAALVFEGD